MAGEGLTSAGCRVVQGSWMQRDSLVQVAVWCRDHGCRETHQCRLQGGAGIMAAVRLTSAGCRVVQGSWLQ